MKLPAVNLDIVEVNNLIAVNSFWNFSVPFSLVPNNDSHKENEFTILTDGQLLFLNENSSIGQTL